MIYETIKQRFPGRDAARVAWCLASRMTTEDIFLLAGLIFLPAFLRASVGHTGASGYLAVSDFVPPELQRNLLGLFPREAV
jgi:hypothetical protein